MSILWQERLGLGDPGVQEGSIHMGFAGQSDGSAGEWGQKIFMKDSAEASTLE